MARLPDLEAFATEHGLKIGTIADLIEYRSRQESPVKRARPAAAEHRPGEFTATRHVFRDHPAAPCTALVKASGGADDDVLVRVHEPLSVLDLLDGALGGHSWPPARPALRPSRPARGVAMLLNCGEPPELLAACSRARRQPRPPRGQHGPAHLRRGRADPARRTGRHRMRLLGSPRRMPSMTGYGLK